MTFHTVAFGDLDAGVWGVWWGGAQLFVSPNGSLGGDALLTGREEDEPWHVSGEGIELDVLPQGPGAKLVPPGSDEPVGFDQLCRVRGSYTAAGVEQAVDCLGHRGDRGERMLPEQFDSVRELAAWFEPDEGLTLVSARPRRERGHEHDLVAAAVFDAGQASQVADPRLSTTYSEDGVPTRTSLELWIEIPSDEDDDEESTRQYPRRAAAEAIGSNRTIPDAPLAMRLQALQWHYRGRVGAGLYLLARPR